MDYKTLKEIVSKQGTEKSQNLLKDLLDKCEGEKKTPNEALSEINQLIINPTAFGVC